MRVSHLSSTSSWSSSAKDFPGLVIAEEPEWRNCVQGSTAVVNLAGPPISTRWSPEIKNDIKDSRFRVTSKVVDMINKSPVEARPTVLVSATAVGYYGLLQSFAELPMFHTLIMPTRLLTGFRLSGTSETGVFDEKSPSGNDYLSEVCREWEGTALKANKDVRVALIRIGVVLGKDGGALGDANEICLQTQISLLMRCECLFSVLAMMIPFFKMFAGGPLGSGQQW